ncbi:MAG TPA: hypothetical protein VLI07_18595 [Candidatus Binatus sp.]|nr:hypothetical protein [Candidatus Binatus sp.]
MAAPQSLLRGARAFARDFARDSMPQGYLWDVLDYVPITVDALLTGRAGWLWGSTAMGGDAESGLLALYSNGDQLVIQGTNGQLYSVGLTDPYTATATGGAVPRSAQNPVLYTNDQVIHFDQAGSMTPRIIKPPTSSTLAVTAMNAAHKFSKVGCVYKSRLVTGGAPGETDTIRFSFIDQPDLSNAASFDAKSYIRMNGAVSALAAMRSLVLVFHAGSVERIRGSTPPFGTEDGDMFVEKVFDRIGCIDPKTIAFWNDNCIFADEHGVHVTDGSVVRNIVAQGGILTYWRNLYANKVSMAGVTFMDYYVISLNFADGSSTTLISDLQKRQWFRFGNIKALTFISSSGSSGMERTWGGQKGTNRLIRLGPCFFPNSNATTVADADGTLVLPSFETPWYRLGQEGRKRVKSAWLSYDARVTPIPPNYSTATPVLDLGYMRSPQDPAYTSVGGLPPTNQYTRYKLPVGQFPYGIAFRVRQTQPTVATRIFDLAVDEWVAERGR